MKSYAEVMFAVGRQAQETGDTAGAERVLRLVAGSPWHTAEALYFLGFLRLEQGDNVEALRLIFSATLITPNDTRMLCHMGQALHRLDHHDLAVGCLRAAINLQPDLVTAHAILGASLYSQGELDEALQHFRRVLELEPGNAQMPYFESLVLLTKGDYLVAWDKHEARLKVAWGGNKPRDFAQPLWSGDEDISNKTILLHAEQGFGDAIQFLRYVPLVVERGAIVLLELDPHMVPLCSNFLGVSTVIARGDELPSFDLHCPLLSLPRAFRTELTTIPATVPYLYPDAAHKIAWQKRLGAQSARRVGITWSGNPIHPNDRARSIPLTAFAPLLARSDLEFHAVQQYVRPTDRETLQSMPQLHDHSPSLTNFAETAALLSHMDLVISADTAVAHLAGAMALPTWLLLPMNADWRWLVDRNDSPWYPTMRLFRQPARGDWQSVFEAILAEL